MCVCVCVSCEADGSEGLLNDSTDARNLKNALPGKWVISVIKLFSSHKHLISDCVW